MEWLEGTTKERDSQLRLPRLRVYLKAEDPFNFADRVADAHASKEVGPHTIPVVYASALATAHQILHLFHISIAAQEAELTILYNFYIDCMPSDDMAEVRPSLLRTAGGGSFGVYLCLPSSNSPARPQLGVIKR